MHVFLHRINRGEIDNTEEEDSGTECNWSIAFTCGIDFGFSYFGILDSLVNFCSKFL
jgi:hypothetical protein